MFSLTPHRCSVLAIERDVEDAGAELLVHLPLQLQAPAHPRLDTAVVVANRQQTGLRLCAKEHFSRVLHCRSVAIRAGGLRRPVLPEVLSGSWPCGPG